MHHLSNKKAMTDTTDTKPESSSKIISDFIDSYNSPEAIKRREETRKETKDLADSIISGVTKCEIADLQNNVILSCLSTDVSLYKEYADTIKEHPEYQKYLQLYHYKWNDFIIVPTISPNTNKLVLSTIKLEKEGGKSIITHDNSFDSQDSYVHPYSKDSNVIPLKIHDSTQQYWYSTISMNKWTGEISETSPENYKMDEKWINWLLNTIWEKSGKKLSECSTWLQENIRWIVWVEDELRQASHSFEEQKRKLAENLTKWNFALAVGNFIDIVKSFFNRKKQGRVIDIWRWLNYEWDEKDFDYLRAAIDTVLDPEERSKLTYLISKIKDKQTKSELSNKGINNPSAFDLMLQECKPWQVMLTNALDLEGGSSNFKYATQAVSWSRWCHALIISDVIKDSNWVITDAKIIQSTLKGWVHETRLKDYIKTNYSSADFLLADLPEDKKDDVIGRARSKIWEKYDRVSIVTDSITWMDFDSSLSSWREDTQWDMKSNLMWKNKTYCSELVFDAMWSAGLHMPQPHMSPADILTTDQIKPQYACYCDKF